MKRGIKDEWSAEAEGKFWSKTELDPVTGCINWTGCQAGPANSRYGHFFAARRTFRAHVYAMIISNPTLGTEIPKGLQVNHKCHNKLCVNPEHLYLGTQQDNVNDIFACGHTTGPMLGTRKFTAQQAQKICDLYRSGMLQRKIAKKFGIRQSTISKIVSGRYSPGYPCVGKEKIGYRPQKHRARKGCYSTELVRKRGFHSLHEYRQWLKARKEKENEDLRQRESGGAA